MCYLGQPLTYQKFVPGDTVRYISSSIVKYEERKLAYTSGGTYVMKVGDTIVGATSAATAVIVSRTITTGTDAGGNAEGVLTIKCQIGTFQSENLNVEANSNVATIAADSSPAQNDYPNKGQQCKALLVQASDETALINSGTIIPGQTSLAGIELSAGSSIIFVEINEINSFCCLDKTSGSASTVRVHGYF